MQSVQSEKLNRFGVVALALLGVAILVSEFGPDSSPLTGLVLIASLGIGAYALWRSEPGKELGFIAVVLALIGLTFEYIL